ncbi:MAG: hypothetical protein CMLOHMNK_02559 [Steroidobacteraceae bacterium]|nr:hypothetical protein [Steroidobacteraceae bacterium]
MNAAATMRDSGERFRACARIALAALAIAGTACAPQEGTIPTVSVGGGNSPPMPPLPPADAHIDPSALEAAALHAEREGAAALLVVRNGHLVFERYWHGATFATPIGTGAWQGVIDDLLAGALAEDRRPLPAATTPDRASISAAAGMPYEAYLSKRLWRPLGAYDATLAPALHAAQGDWIRIGELLANDGAYLGEEIVRPGWAAQVLARHAVPGQRPTSGALRDVYRLRGPDDADLWVIPPLRLVILRTGAAVSAARDGTDARMFDAVLRGVTDRPGVQAVGEGMPDPAVLVPSH